MSFNQDISAVSRNRKRVVPAKQCSSWIVGRFRDSKPPTVYLRNGGLPIGESALPRFEVTPRTIDNYIEKNSTELRQNGYDVLNCK